ncbi:uncharacterized protein LOC143197536 [Rhynchophorus ferrugineus]|uniref:uncharacterized protein LOC143197536 n=1 Tax=Rhynchophorus ferrugineus TaxID=354439 RepID=UPI003FCCFDDA
MASGDPSRDPPTRRSLSDIGEEFLKTLLSHVRSLLNLQVLLSPFIDMTEINRFMDDLHREIHMRRFRVCLEEMHARFLYCTQSRTKVEDWLASLDEEDLSVPGFDVTPPEIYFQKFRNEIIDIWLIQLEEYRKTVSTSTGAFDYDQFIRELRESLLASMREYERMVMDFNEAGPSSRPDPVPAIEDKKEDEREKKGEKKKIIPRLRRVHSCFF